MNKNNYPGQVLHLDSLTSIYKFHTIVDVLRLDLIHPVISGNKWFKLIRYINDAIHQKKSVIVTFGGAYSNHVVATAAACQLFGLKCYGVIRGEKPTQLSPTLTDAINFGMEILFIDRNYYRQKTLPTELLVMEREEKLYLINEGGFGEKGAEGIEEMLTAISLEKYSTIITAVGTGTTLAGIVKASSFNQKCIGISVMKNNMSLNSEINSLLNPHKQDHFTLYHEYHFGAYAKYNQELLDFINEFYRKTSIPLDFVYTGKVFYALNDLIEKGIINKKENILIVHTGGLQGNRSLAKGTLIFS
jgi:1-aminocyclopropane-1-carboxylate deaminase